MHSLDFTCRVAVAALLLANGALASQPIEPVMATIPAATFKMGDDGTNVAKPAYDVSLKSFSIGVYEVTVHEFRQFIEATGHEMPQTCRHELDDWMKPASAGSWDSNFPTSHDFQPVVCIGWNGAKAYAAWLADVTGRPYRLPTEAEWEYAALAGARTKYHFGDDPEGTEMCLYDNSADQMGENILQRTTNTSYVNFGDGKNNCVDHAGFSSIVGMYKPNRFGLYDTIGNVFEFVEDCFLPGYEGAPTDGSARQDDTCSQRAVRGSSWHWKADPQTTRMGFGADFIGGIEGFRLALDGPAPEKSESTATFEQDLRKAQASEQKRRDATPPLPATVSNLRLEQKGAVATLRWDAVKDADFYRVYRNFHTGGRFRVIADNIMATHFHDANMLPGIYEYSVVAVRSNLQGDYSQAVTTNPGTQTLPGRLEAEYFASATGAVPRAAYDESRQSYGLTGATGIAADAVTSYQLVVTKGGTYRLAYRVAARRDGEGFELWLDNRKVGGGSVAGTGGYWMWQTQQNGTVQLEEGHHRLEIRSKDTNWKLNWIELVAATEEVAP